MFSDASDVWGDEVLKLHNETRVEHNAPHLTSSDGCYASAREQADACQASGDLASGHVDGPSGQHGQNVSMGSPHPGSSRRLPDVRGAMAAASGVSARFRQSFVQPPAVAPLDLESCSDNPGDDPIESFGSSEEDIFGPDGVDEID